MGIPTNDAQTSMSKQDKVDSIGILNDVRKQLIDCEEDTKSICQNLSEQKNKIASAIDKTKQINGSLSTSNNILSRMMKWWTG